MGSPSCWISSCVWIDETTPQIQSPVLDIAVPFNILFVTGQDMPCHATRVENGLALVRSNFVTSKGRTVSIWKMISRSVVYSISSSHRRLCTSIGVHRDHPFHQRCDS